MLAFVSAAAISWLLYRAVPSCCCCSKHAGPARAHARRQREREREREGEGEREKERVLLPCCSFLLAGCHRRLYSLSGLEDCSGGHQPTRPSHMRTVFVALPPPPPYQGVISAAWRVGGGGGGGLSVCSLMRVETVLNRAKCSSSRSDCAIRRSLAAADCFKKLGRPSLMSCLAVGLEQVETDRQRERERERAEREGEGEFVEGRCEQ